MNPTKRRRLIQELCVQCGKVSMRGKLKVWCLRCRRRINGNHRGRWVYGR